MTKFKDKCDECNKYDYLKSINNKCYCSICYKKMLIITKNNKKNKININFMYNSHFSHSISDIMYL